jgi:hypothetical protein
VVGTAAGGLRGALEADRAAKEPKCNMTRANEWVTVRGAECLPKVSGQPETRA